MWGGGAGGGGAVDSECKIKFKGKICRVHRVHVPSTSPWFPCFSCPLLPVTVHYQTAPPGVALLLPPGLGVEVGVMLSVRGWSCHVGRGRLEG